MSLYAKNINDDDNNNNNTNHIGDQAKKEETQIVYFLHEAYLLVGFHFFLPNWP